MKRYYITKIIGDGTENNPYRPKIADAGVSWVGAIPTGADGKPLFAWAFVLAATANHVTLLADTDNDGLPDLSPDATLGSLSTLVRTALLNRLADRGIDVSDIKTTTTYRALLNRVGQRLSGAFDINRFDVAE